MPTYKSFTAAIKDLMLPMDRAGESVINSIKTMINTNSVPGKELSAKWKARKAQNANTKLLEYGYLRDATKYSVEKFSVEIGYENSTSNHTSLGKGQMTYAGMAEVHNEGNNKGMFDIPKRPFLFDGGSWNQKHKEAIQKFIQTYYQNKGII